MLRIFSFLLIFITISSCGYKTIYTNDDAKFKIGKIIKTGDSKVNHLIVNRLNNYSSNKNTEKIFDLEINTLINKKISSKDSKGNPKIFELEIICETKIILNDNEKFIKNIKKAISYNNISSKFELQQYERNLVENISEKIFEDIVLFLQRL